MIRKFPLAILVCLLSYGYASAQTVSDSLSLSHITANYNTAIGLQSRFYNGPEAHYYPPGIKGNAYAYDMDQFTPGSVNYDGIEYTNVPIIYDANLDVVVGLLYDKITKFTLLSDYVKDFTLLNHHFVHIRKDTVLLKKSIDPGFYNELYAGKNIQVLVKLSKNYQSITNANDIENYFDPHTDYYLKKADGYYSFSSQSTLINLLKEKKKELQQYIKTNKIKYRDNPNQAITSIAIYYDSLTN